MECGFTVRKHLFLICLGLSASVTSGQTMPAGAPVVQAPGERISRVPDKYRFLYDPNRPNAVRSTLPFENISLEQSGGLGVERYLITLRRDGSAAFNAYSPAPSFKLFAGKYTGNIPLQDYGRLCYLLEHLDIGKLASDVRDPNERLVYGVTTIVRAHRKGKDRPIEKTEANENGAIELWAIRMVIERICQRIYWNRVKGRAGSNVLDPSPPRPEDAER